MRIVVLLLTILFPTLAFAQPEIGKPVPDFAAHAADGADIHLSDYLGRIIVLEWSNPQCPFVHKFYDSGAMQKLQTDVTAKNIVWLTINSGAPGKEGNMTDLEARDYVTSNHVASTHYILDPTGDIGRLYGAKTTPHMFVIDAKGNLAYMGAMDDKPTTDKTTLSTAHNYVRAALDSILANQPVAVSSTQSYGCSVKY